MSERQRECAYVCVCLKRDYLLIPSSLNGTKWNVSITYNYVNDGQRHRGSKLNVFFKATKQEHSQQFKKRSSSVAYHDQISNVSHIRTIIVQIPIGFVIKTYFMKAYVKILTGVETLTKAERYIFIILQVFVKKT